MAPAGGAVATGGMRAVLVAAPPALTGAGVVSSVRVARAMAPAWGVVATGGMRAVLVAAPPIFAGAGVVSSVRVARLPVLPAGFIIAARCVRARWPGVAAVACATVVFPV